MSKEKEAMLYELLGELMYQEEHCYDWLEKKLLQSKIKAVHTLLEIQYAHQPSIIK